MGIFAGDLVIRQAIELGLQDIRDNPWLLDDIMGSFSTDLYLTKAYGSKEIENCRLWFLNNKIQVNLRYRLDKEEYPCITIGLGGSSEKEDMKTLSDLTSTVEELMPAQINKTIPFIVKPFVPSGYDKDLGFLSVSPDTSLRKARAGQILVDPDTGNGWEIVEITAQGIKIADDTELTGTRFAIVPKYQTYKVRRESSHFQEQYSIGCHVIGETSQLLWLHAIVLYSLLRYKESLLESRGFTQTMFSSTDLAPNSGFSLSGAENVYSRYINLTGMVENSWIKSPTRVIESIDLVDNQGVNGLKAGIKILSNLDAPEELDTENDTWTTKKDDGFETD